jgi:hypothetical protein
VVQQSARAAPPAASTKGKPKSIAAVASRVFIAVPPPLGLGHSARPHPANVLSPAVASGAGRFRIAAPRRCYRETVAFLGQSTCRPGTKPHQESLQDKWRPSKQKILTGRWRAVTRPYDNRSCSTGKYLKFSSIPAETAGRLNTISLHAETSCAEKFTQPLRSADG